MSRVRESAFTLFESISAVFVIIVTAMVMLRILDRIVSVPLTGYAEYAQMMAVWIIFLGIGRAAYHGDDIRSDWVLEQLPTRAESALRGAILVMNAATIAIITVAAFLVLQEFQGRATPAAGIPFPVIHGALLSGSALLFIVYLVLILKGLRSALGGIV